MFKRFVTRVRFAKTVTVFDSRTQLYWAESVDPAECEKHAVKRLKRRAKAFKPSPSPDCGQEFALDGYGFWTVCEVDHSNGTVRLRRSGWGR